MTETPERKDPLVSYLFPMIRYGLTPLLIIALLGMRTSGEPPAPVNNAEWAPAPDLRKHLSKAVTLSSISIQPPAEYVQTRYPNANKYEAAGIKVYLWQKKNAGTSLTLALLPATLKEPWDPERFMDGFAESIARGLRQSSMSEIRKGRLGSVTAVQSKYKGTTKDGDRVTGFLIAFNDDQGTVTLNCMASGDEANTELEILRSSAITCRRVDKHR